MRARARTRWRRWRASTPRVRWCLSPRVQTGVPLAPRSSLRVGGPARWFTVASSAEDVAAAHAWSRAHGAPMVVLGRGGARNVVVVRRRLDALVGRGATRGLTMVEDRETLRVTAAAGGAVGLGGRNGGGTRRRRAGVPVGHPRPDGRHPDPERGRLRDRTWQGWIEQVTAFDTRRRTVTLGRRVRVRVSHQPVQGARRRPLRRVRA
jgi:hypothetical protein